MFKGKPNIYQVNTDVVEGPQYDVRSSQRLNPTKLPGQPHH